jgi:hypothetical protein
VSAGSSGGTSNELQFSSRRKLDWWISANRYDEWRVEGYFDNDVPQFHRKWPHRRDKAAVAVCAVIQGWSNRHHSPSDAWRYDSFRQLATLQQGTDSHFDRRHSG